jgi:hypothetical protein
VRSGKEGEEVREEKRRKGSMSGVGCAAPTMLAATQPTAAATAYEPSRRGAKGGEGGAPESHLETTRGPQICWPDDSNT